MSYQPTANNKKVFFKRSQAGDIDPTFQRKFYDEKQKRDFMNAHGFVEKDEVSETHKRKIRDFVAYCKNERRKNPNFKYKGDYPT